MRSEGMLMGEDDVKKPIAHNPLEQFLLLSKGAKGAASLDLIKTVLEAPGIYVFAELLAQPNIREVNTHTYNDIPFSLSIESIFSLVRCSWKAHRTQTT